MTVFPSLPTRCMAAPKLLLAALVAGLLLATLPAGPADAQSGVARLTNKVDRLQRELNDLQRRVYNQPDGGDADAGSAARSGDGGGQASGGSPQLTGAAAARLQEKLSQLERTVQDLTGRLERVQYDIRQLTQRMDKRANDVDYRLSQLEQAAGISATGDGNQSGQDGSGQPGGQGRQQAQDLQQNAQQGQQNGAGEQAGQNGTGQQSGQTQQARSGQNGQDQGGQDQGGQDETQQGQQGDTLGQVSQRAVDELRRDQGSQQDGGQQGQQASSDDRQSPGGQDGGDGQQGEQTASVKVELPDGSPQEQYDYAFGLLRQADYEQAEQALSKFLDKHPDHELAGNAKYWLGETFYVRGNYERAAVTFAEGFQTYPKSQKAPDNLLKLGMSLAQIDRTEDACGIFAELQSRYPDAKNNILQRAEREQDRLNCGQG